MYISCQFINHERLTGWHISNIPPLRRVLLLYCVAFKVCSVILCIYILLTALFTKSLFYSFHFCIWKLQRLCIAHRSDSIHLLYVRTASVCSNLLARSTCPGYFTTFRSAVSLIFLSHQPCTSLFLNSVRSSLSLRKY